MSEQGLHPTQQSIACVCAICGTPFDACAPSIERGGQALHGRCVRAGHELIGVTAAILAEQRPLPLCARCLAAELGGGHLEVQSALWHLARTHELLPGPCQCGTAGWRLR
jgi:hypothetical protein